MKNAKIVFSMGKMTFAFRNRMSLPGFEPGAFRLGVDHTPVNPLQNRVIYSTLYQRIFCCDVNVCKWIRTFFIPCKQMFISWKLAELMKSGRSIVQRSPFISWKVYVSLRIFACLAFVNQTIQP